MRTDTALYDRYFLRRFIEEMVLSQTAPSQIERDCHKRLSGHFADLLGMNEMREPSLPVAEGGRTR